MDQWDVLQNVQIGLGTTVGPGRQSILFLLPCQCNLTDSSFWWISKDTARSQPNSEMRRAGSGRVPSAKLCHLLPVEWGRSPSWHTNVLATQNSHPIPCVRIVYRSTSRRHNFFIPGLAIEANLQPTWVQADSEPQLPCHLVSPSGDQPLLDIMKEVHAVQRTCYLEKIPKVLDITSQEPGRKTR